VVSPDGVVALYCSELSIVQRGSSVVALGMKPEPVYLRPGDVVELGIDQLGRSRQEVIGPA